MPIRFAPFVRPTPFPMKPSRSMTTRTLRPLDDDDSDPMLSAINLVDVFLVAMVMLMIAMVNRPTSPLANGDVTQIKNEGQPNMEIVVKQGERLTRFQATGASSQGTGEKAGTAYRMQDGSMVYVPHDLDDTTMPTTTHTKPQVTQ